MSPLARTMKLYRERGYVVDKTEHTIPKTFIKRDLFGIFDALCLGPAGEVVGVQATSGDHVAVRVRKIEASEHLERIRLCGISISVIGWRKNAKGRWAFREVAV